MSDIGKMSNLSIGFWIQMKKSKNFEVDQLDKDNQIRAVTSATKIFFLQKNWLKM